MVEQNQVYLFIPCLVDQVIPEVGVALYQLLVHLGFSVKYTAEHTCCGQPAFNAGHRNQARPVALSFIKSFPDELPIVTVSGSCTAMVRCYYKQLFEGTGYEAQASAFSGRVFEFSEFVVRRSLHSKFKSSASGAIGFHNSCHTYRELGISEEPFKILHQISGCKILNQKDEPTCCGFGGVFSVKFPEIGERMGYSRLEYFRNIGADRIVANDPGCIIHLRQEAKSRGIDIPIEHLVEFLARALKLPQNLSPLKAQTGG